MERISGWFVAMSFLLISSDHVVNGGWQYVKTSEVGARPIHGFFCGDHIISLYFAVCYSSQSRRQRSVMMDEKEAKGFLHRFKRESTDIVEECCIEGCHVEEVREYC